MNGGTRPEFLGREYYLGITLLKLVHPFTQSYDLISWWYNVFVSIYFVFFVIIFWECIIDLDGSLDLFCIENVNLVYWWTDFVCLMHAGSCFILEVGYVGDGFLGLPLYDLVCNGF